MNKFEIKNIIYGAETAIIQTGYNLISPEIVTRDEEGNATVIDAVYGNVPVYNHTFEGFEIPENDEGYFVTLTVYIKSNTASFGDFEKVLRIPSLNSMTGFEVDALREKFISDWLAEINK